MTLGMKRKKSRLFAQSLGMVVGIEFSIYGNTLFEINES